MLLPDRVEVDKAKDAMLGACRGLFKDKRGNAAAMAVGVMNEAILQMATETLVLRIVTRNKDAGGIREALTEELKGLGEKTLKCFNEHAMNTRRARQEAASLLKGIP